MDLVRLACVKHAASVHPEPGSNSPTKTCPSRSPTEVGSRAGNECQRAHHPSRERLVWTMRPCCVVLSNRYPCCRRQGVPTAELTDSHRDPEGRPTARTGVLSSL